MYTCPLFRGFYFSISCRCSCFQSRVIISVPFPGIFFLNLKKGVLYGKRMYSFRPLPGDLISQLATIQRNLKINSGFPSPSRGSYFSIASGNIRYVTLPQSFRPLSGDLISQFWKRFIYQLFWCRVSVPFPGILFLNLIKKLHRVEWRAMFPSPFRGSYFSIKVQ